MLYSQFFIEDDRYVISINNIIEIIPCVGLRSSPMLPEYAAGLLNYHGNQVPVIDVCRLLVDRPCKKKLSTRIIVVDGNNLGGDLFALGFMVERATETISIDAELFQSEVMRNPANLIAGQVAMIQGNLITKVSVSEIYEKLDQQFFSVLDDSSHRVSNG